MEFHTEFFADYINHAEILNWKRFQANSEMIKNNFLKTKNEIMPRIENYDTLL